MSDKYTCCVDKERLSESVKTLNNLEDSINNDYLSNNILEIEEIIRNININHNNCIVNYKDKINNILEELQKLKKSINKLSTSVSVTIKEFSAVDEFKTKDIEDIFGKFDNSTDVANLAVNNNLKVADNVYSFKESMATNIANATEINAVPVGLGIAAAGVTGAVGAVVVNSMDKHEKESYYDYKEPEEHKEMKYDYDNLNKVEENRNKLANEMKEEEISPYFANRDKIKNDKFYDDFN